MRRATRTCLSGLVAVASSVALPACDGRAVLARIEPEVVVPPGTFDGPPNPDPLARPALVYPLDGVTLGRNVPGMMLQWHAGAGNALFRVRVERTDGGAPIPPFIAESLSCPDAKCKLAVADDKWGITAAALAGTSAALYVDAVARPAAPVATSAPIRVSFTTEPLPGDLYFFSVPKPGYEGGAIQRASASSVKHTTFASAATKPSRGHCVGCHTVTRDGCRVAMNSFDPATVGGNVVIPSRFMVVVPAKDQNRDLVGADVPSAFQTWSPDGTRMLTVSKGQLTLRDGVGKKVLDVPPAFVGGTTSATHPDWSPDGKSIVFVRLHEGARFHDDPFHSGDVMVMPYNDGKFAPAVVLVPSTKTEFHYYPSFSPDSRFVVFNTGTTPGKAPHTTAELVPMETYVPYDQETSRLRIVSAAGGTPLELHHATQGMNKSASWPRFAPRLIDAGPGRGKVAFIVFSSKINYGFVLDQATVEPIDNRYFGRPQLWAAAVSLDATAGDPSAAPFWWPFQDPALRNHLGQWTATGVDELQCP